MQATRAQSQSYDDLLELFQELGSYLKRFQFRSSRRAKLSPASRRSAVKIFAEILVTLATAERLLTGKKFLWSRRLGEQLLSGYKKSMPFITFCSSKHTT